MAYSRVFVMNGILPKKYPGENIPLVEYNYMSSIDIYCIFILIVFNNNPCDDIHPSDVIDINNKRGQ